MTLACTTLVGDPYVAHVLTWKGKTSMKDTSKAVKNKRYNRVNRKEKRKKKDSFKLVQSAEWYTTTEEEVNGASIYNIPCIAKLDMGKKMKDGDPFFAKYDVDMSLRVYANDKAKKFTSIPIKTTKVDIKKPNTDLKSLYEEDQPTDSSETVEYFNKVFKFKLKNFDKTISSGRGFQRVSGGYKLYGASGAKDRWYFNLAVELPTN